MLNMAFELLLVLIVFLIAATLAYYVGRQRGELLSDKAWHEALPELRKDAIKRSWAVKGGQFSEQLAPYLPDFPFQPTDCRFIGKPIDFLVFKGQDGQIEEVVFLEVKSGSSSLSKREKSLKDAIELKKVSWQEYRVPKDLTS